MAAEVLNNGLDSSEAERAFLNTNPSAGSPLLPNAQKGSGGREEIIPRDTDLSAADFRFASLVALAACPLVLYGSLSEKTWMTLLGILLGPLAIVIRRPNPNVPRPQPIASSKTAK